jgi:hypothetical protein
VYHHRLGFALEQPTGADTIAGMQIGLIFAWILISFAGQAMPTLTGVQPLAVPPGRAIEITLNGANFNNDLRLWTSFGARSEFVKCIDAKQVVFRVMAPKGMAMQVGALRVYDRTGISEPILMLVDPLPTTTTVGTDKSKPVTLKLPVAVDGRMGGVNSIWFSLEARAGQKISVEVYAERIASQADAVIRLLDPKGQEVGFADDDEVLGSDSRLEHRARAAGRYLIELRDVEYRGGASFRLRVGDFPVWPELSTSPGQVSEREPNDDPGQASTMKLGKTLAGNIEKPGAADYFRFNGRIGEWATFRALSRNIGSPAHVYMELLDGAGKSIADTGTGFAIETILRCKLPADGQYLLRVEELLRRGGPQYAYRIRTRAGRGEFKLRLKNGVDSKKKPVAADRFWAIAGQKIEINVQADRHGYEGKIELALDNGWPLEANVIKSKEKETRLLVSVPLDAKPGALHELNLTGMGGGVSKARLDHFSAYRIRWPRLLNPPPILRGGVPVVIIEPVQITMKPVKVKPGAKAKARITTLRPPPPLGAKPDPKPIAIEIKSLPAGLSVPDKIVVDAKKDFVEFEITCAADAKSAKGEAVIVAKSSYRGAPWVKASAPVAVEISRD